MKKILIVDDTQANLDAAKAFFSTISGYEFIYATNRKDAEVLLPEAYAVITDRSLPSNTDVEFLDCEIPEDKMGLVKVCFVQANGYHIFYSAHLAGKPVVMAMEHGSFGMSLPKITPINELSENQTSDWDFDPKDFSMEKLLLEIDTNPSLELYDRLWSYGNFGGARHLGWKEDLLKTNTEAWKMAWEELQKQF